MASSPAFSKLVKLRMLWCLGLSLVFIVEQRMLSIWVYWKLLSFLVSNQAIYKLFLYMLLVPFCRKGNPAPLTYLYINRIHACVISCSCWGDACSCTTIHTVFISAASLLWILMHYINHKAQTWGQKMPVKLAKCSKKYTSVPQKRIFLLL